MQKTGQTEVRIEKVIKKGDKFEVKWKGFDNSHNRWTDKKDIVIQNGLFCRTIKSWQKQNKNWIKWFV